MKTSHTLAVEVTGSRLVAAKSNTAAPVRVRTAVPEGSDGGWRVALATIASVLDGLGLAFCFFDEQDRTVLWNGQFLEFFPEHRGHVHEGEAYAQNLRRFYDARLVGHEREQLEHYVSDGIARHRSQERPFNFYHRDKHLRVGSAALKGRGRIRIWQCIAPPQDAAYRISDIQELARNFADGFAITDSKDRILFANQEFLRLYDLGQAGQAAGLTLADIVDGLWRDQTQPWAQHTTPFLDNARFSGAPFEVELPGERWRRVVEHRTADGTTYSTHADISALMTRQRELVAAHEALSARNSKLLALAGTDALTGIANRRRFDATLARRWARAAATRRPIGLLMVDIDHFKSVNDRHGHVAGDACLRQVAVELAKTVRSSADLVARYGGEEFAVILPGADGNATALLGETLREVVENMLLDVHGCETALTVSIGGASECPTPDRSGGSTILLERADRALYRAKSSGRNRVEIDQGS